MNLPSKTKHNSLLNHEEQPDEREIWFKLVVKIITWKEGISKDISIDLKDKITSKEWGMYCKKMIQTNISFGKIKVLANLKEIKERIEKNGGFVDHVR